LMTLGFELKASHLLGRWSTTWAISLALFCVGCFWYKVLQIVCPAWPQMVMPLFSASRMVRITGVSHQHPATFYFSTF
jgi:hypothetical protein